MSFADDQAAYYLDAAGEMLIEELGALRDERKEIEAREKKVREEILDMLGGKVKALTADGRPAATVTVSVRRNIDRARLEALYPDIFEDVITESEVVTLRIQQ